MIKKLPLIQLEIDPENQSFVSAISIVESPAIESSFIAFSDELKQNKHQKFNLSSDEKMELIGAAMIPNVPIYRFDEKVGEFAVQFSEKTIREIAQVFSKKGFNKNLNLEHSKVNANSYVFQSYITDLDKGIAAPKGIDVPNGTWIVGVKVEDAEVWKEIKSGKKTGFSIEGIFEFIDTEKMIDFQFNKLIPSKDLISFSKELESELDSIIKILNL